MGYMFVKIVCAGIVVSAAKATRTYPFLGVLLPYMFDTSVLIWGPSNTPRNGAGIIPCFKASRTHCVHIFYKGIGLM